MGLIILVYMTSQPSGEYHNTFDITAKWGIPQYHNKHIGQSSRETAILRLTSQPSGEYHNITFDITAKWGIPQYV
jgi:hypothetical protein